MMRLSQNKQMDRLMQAILSLQNEEECYKFFLDLCTINENITFANRLEVARQLSLGTTYLNISEETENGSAIISRTKKCMQYGNGGYQMVLARLQSRSTK